MLDAPIAIQLRGLSKSYPLYSGPAEMALDRFGLGWIARWRRGGSVPMFEALRSIDLNVRKGERVGIVGRNGAGKTTLLKLITGNFTPTKGQVEVNGQVQALMTTGLGFHPEFSGIENVRSALTYNGLSGRKLEAAVEDVVDFVELGEFLERPMSTYSLGMGARLQFAVATAVEPDIMIVDEVLGAGDAYFTVKSAARMRKLAFSGCTFLLVSHAPQQILQFCDRAIWLDRGRIIEDGDAPAVLNAYEATMERAAGGALSHGADLPTYEPDRLADGREVHRWPGELGIKFYTVDIFAGRKPEKTDTVRTGELARIEFDVLVETDMPLRCVYIVTFWTSDGHRICRIESHEDEFTAPAGSIRRVRIDLGEMIINPGRFLLSFAAYDRNGAGQGQTRYDILYRSVPLKVVGEAASPGFCFKYPSDAGTSAKSIAAFQ